LIWLCFRLKTSYQIGASFVYFYLLFFPHIIYAILNIAIENF
jgi:hypothetical protein